MCGIIAAIAKNNIVDFLLKGLKDLEYRGYDSAGVAVINQGQLQRFRVAGKVEKLAELTQQAKAQGYVGIAHTRWATHGKPTLENAHPHFTHNKIAVVHNGIIENFEALKVELQNKDYSFTSQTDSEVIAHLIHFYYQQTNDMFSAITQAKQRLHGAYGVAVICQNEPQHIYVLRSGSPLVIGVGENENFVASDPLALAQKTHRVIYLEEGDFAKISIDNIEIFDAKQQQVQRQVQTIDIEHHDNSLGDYAHYMLKEIYEQPQAIAATLSQRLQSDKINFETLDDENLAQLKKVKNIHIVACGTSYHAGLVAKYWLEPMANIACSVEVASEFRYRHQVVPENTLLLLISQSGETADLLAALRDSQDNGYLASLAIVNVARSTLAREADIVLTTKAGVEVGVASTKAFTAQLTVLALLTLQLLQFKDNKKLLSTLIEQIQQLPHYIETSLKMGDAIANIANDFAQKQHALFLGRGDQYPIAMEGALKLKEISYIHAEAYAAGELKHGPLALIDANMPVIATVPDNNMLDKIKANLQEVSARGGELIIFTDNVAAFTGQKHLHILPVVKVPSMLQPIVYTIPLQLLSYYVALVKGTDVDKPRNLAKSVTVE